jgi:hypothetical protein
LLDMRESLLDERESPLERGKEPVESRIGPGALGVEAIVEAVHPAMDAIDTSAQVEEGAE